MEVARRLAPGALRSSVHASMSPRALLTAMTGVRSCNPTSGTIRSGAQSRATSCRMTLEPEERSPCNFQACPDNSGSAYSCYRKSQRTEMCPESLISCCILQRQNYSDFCQYQVSLQCMFIPHYVSILIFKMNLTFSIILIYKILALHTLCLKWVLDLFLLVPN